MKYRERSEEMTLNINDLFIDNREPKALIDHFIFLTSIVNKFDSFKIRKKQLAVGDMVLGNLGGERKTIADFIASIRDGRIFEQAYNMSQNFKFGVIMVAGELSECIDPAEIKGILTTIADIQIRYNIQVIFCMNDEYLAYYFLGLCYKLKKKVEPLWVMRRSQPKTKDEQLLMITGVKGIGSKIGRNALKHYKTMKALVNASQDELIKNFGNKKGSQMFKVFNEEYSDVINEPSPEDQNQES